MGSCVGAVPDVVACNQIAIPGCLWAGSLAAAIALTRHDTGIWTKYWVWIAVTIGALVLGGEISFSI